MPLLRKAAAVAALLLWAGAAEADPGAPPNPVSRPPSVTPPPPNVIFAPPNVTPAPPSVLPSAPHVFAGPRRCRIVVRTDSFGMPRQVRRCRTGSWRQDW